jgi:hypothetical protein
MVYRLFSPRTLFKVKNDLQVQIWQITVDDVFLLGPVEV